MSEMSSAMAAFCAIRLGFDKRNCAHVGGLIETCLSVAKGSSPRARLVRVYAIPVQRRFALVEYRASSFWSVLLGDRAGSNRIGAILRAVQVTIDVS
jgi:hypothetical protein